MQTANSSLANATSSNNCSSPPLSPPPSYEASTSMQQLSLPPGLPKNQGMLLNNLNTTNKLYHDHSSFTNSLFHNHHNHHHHLNQSSYVDYTNRYQSLNRKVHPKLEEFKQNNLVVNLDDCTNSKTNFNNLEDNFNSSKSLDRSDNTKENAKH
jgi:hypothetical protein